MEFEHISTYKTFQTKYTAVFSREELYEMVWETPIQQLAKKFFLSDVGLAKICRKNHIPLPGRGYWRRIETGKKSFKKSLPKINKDALARTINIIDTLLIGLEARNFRVKWPEIQTDGFLLIINNITVGFSISERLKRKDHIPTKEEVEQQKRLSLLTPPKWDYQPSGKLTLNLIPPIHLWNIKYKWNDKNSSRLEDQLNEIFIEIYKIAEEY